MKRIKHFALALAAVILLSNINYVQASELATVESTQINDEISVLTTTIKYYTFNRTRKTYTVGTQTVNANATMTLYADRQNGLSLVQGTVYLLPIASNGTQYTFTFSNYSRDTMNIDLSRVEPGAYIVKIEGASVGTNTEVQVTYTFNN